MESLPYQEKRPWGNFTTFFHNSDVTVKLLTVDPGQAFSLQSHQNRDEEWHIISGNGFITIGESRAEIEINKDYFIPRQTNHRLEAGTEAIVALEIARGNFDENDITRIEDRYGRA